MSDQVSRDPDEGLRERKKREMRQRISDVATEMFITRGYDEVKISEIAEAVGVSEKTIYNYFPTKEGLVFDHADEQRRALTGAVREREPGTSPVAAFVTALKAPLALVAARLTEGDDDGMMSAFGEMVRATPALQAAWGEHRHRLVDELTQILAANYRMDPREAELLMAARATVSLLELYFDSQVRHVEDGLVGDALVAAVEEDLDRGARLIETGLMSLTRIVEERREGDSDSGAASGPASGSAAASGGPASRRRGPSSISFSASSSSADAAANEAREKVMSALREAMQEWKQFSDQAVAAGREIRDTAMSAENGDYSYVRELARQRAEELKNRAQEMAQSQAHVAREAAREAERRRDN